MTRLMMRFPFIVMLAVLALLGQPGHGVAQSPDKPDGAVEGGRYSFHRMGESFIRLDAQTGQVAQCGEQADPDGRHAMAPTRAATRRANSTV